MSSPPRVLTLEEVNAAQGDAWLYLEYRREYAYSISAHRMASVIRAMHHAEHRKQYYGTRYRCWDKKPCQADKDKNEWRT